MNTATTIILVILSLLVVGAIAIPLLKSHDAKISLDSYPGKEGQVLKNLQGEWVASFDVGAIGTNISPMSLPTPTRALLGGVYAYNCTGNDKVRAINEYGHVICSNDLAGGGGSSSSGVTEITGGTGITASPSTITSIGSLAIDFSAFTNRILLNAANITGLSSIVDTNCNATGTCPSVVYVSDANKTSVSCLNLTGGSDGDFCADANSGGTITSISTSDGLVISTITNTGNITVNYTQFTNKTLLSWNNISGVNLNVGIVNWSNISNVNIGTIAWINISGAPNTTDQVYVTSNFAALASQNQFTGLWQHAQGFNATKINSTFEYGVNGNFTNLNISGTLNYTGNRVASLDNKIKLDYSNLTNTPTFTDTSNDTNCNVTNSCPLILYTNNASFITNKITLDAGNNLTNYQGLTNKSLVSCKNITGGSDADYCTDAGGSGTVTSVEAGSGLNPINITSNGTLSVNYTALTNRVNLHYTNITGKNAEGSVAWFGNSQENPSGVQRLGHSFLNFVLNGGMEYWNSGTTSAPDGWIVQGATIRRNNTYSSGTYSVELTMNATDDNIYQSIPVYYQTDITAGLYYKVISGTGAVYCVLQEDGGSYTHYAQSYIDLTIDGTWKFCSVSATKPNDGVDAMRLKFAQADGTATNTVVLIDEVMFQEGKNLSTAFTNNVLDSETNAQQILGSKTFVGGLISQATSWFTSQLNTAKVNSTEVETAILNFTGQRASTLDNKTLVSCKNITGGSDADYCTDDGGSVNYTNIALTNQTNTFAQPQVINGYLNVSNLTTKGGYFLSNQTEYNNSIPAWRFDTASNQWTTDNWQMPVYAWAIAGSNKMGIDGLGNMYTLGGNFKTTNTAPETGGDAYMGHGMLRQTPANGFNFAYGESIATTTEPGMDFFPIGGDHIADGLLFRVSKNSSRNAPAFTINQTGDVIINGSLWVNGTKINGGSGTVTQVDAGNGLNTASITTTGTLSINYTHFINRTLVAWSNLTGINLNVGTIDGANITTGTIGDVRLSTNVTYLGSQNVFTGLWNYFRNGNFSILNTTTLNVAGEAIYGQNNFITQANGGLWLGAYQNYDAGILRNVAGDLFLRGNFFDSLAIMTTGNVSITRMNATQIDVANTKVTGQIVHNATGVVRSFSNGCTETSNSSGLIWEC